jgi:hypothetical protein
MSFRALDALYSGLAVVVVDATISETLIVLFGRFIT